MTGIDQIKILDDKVKSNQAQSDLGREAAKISALSSKDLLEKYEYSTGEDLGHRPSALEKTKFEYSSLGAVFANNAKNKKNSKKKQEKSLVYNSQQNFTKFKDIVSLDSMYKKVNEFKQKLIGLKMLLQKMKIKTLS